MTSSRAPQHTATSTLPLKGTVQLNTTAQRQQKAHRQQKVQQQKWRQRSSARSNDSWVSATTPKGVPRWISRSSNPHQDFHHRHQQPTTSREKSWCPLPSSSSHHNSQSLRKKKTPKKKLMAVRSVNTRSLPGDVIMHTPTGSDVNALVMSA